MSDQEQPVPEGAEAQEVQAEAQEAQEVQAEAQEVQAGVQEVQAGVQIETCTVMHHFMYTPGRREGEGYGAGGYDPEGMFPWTAPW